MDTKSRLIKYLWYSPHRKELMKLFGVLKFYGISTKLIFPTISKCIKSDMSDFSIISLLDDMIKKSEKPIKKQREREKNRAEDILRLLSTSKQMPFFINKESEVIGTYLDIGSGDGLITKTIGDTLGLSSDCIYAVDVYKWIGQENKVEAKDIQFSFLDLKVKKVLPYEDNFFDLITVLQALHHFENLPIMMKEIKRVCKPGGTVIIREHNADTKYIKALTDLEHLLYSILHDGLTIEDFSRNYYGVYRSSVEWDNLFIQQGFQPVYKIGKNNPTKYYYAVYNLPK